MGHMLLGLVALNGHGLVAMKIALSGKFNRRNLHSFFFVKLRAQR